MLYHKLYDLISCKLVGVGRYGECGLYCALCVGSDNTSAYIIRIKVASDSGPIICLSCSGTCDN